METMQKQQDVSMDEALNRGNRSRTGSFPCILNQAMKLWRGVATRDHTAEAQGETGCVSSNQR